MKPKILVIIIFLFIFKYGNSQLTISTGNSASYYVQNVLLGGGVMASNITFTGNGNQIGEFSNGNTTDLGFDRGIVLSSGNVSDIPQSAGGFASTDYYGNGDASLNGLAGATTHDAAILEFDFYTEASHVQFRYIFASEEYPEFVNSGYNDAFAFFLSGPNPNGGSYSNYNMALIPGTSTPVTIDNVNDYTNSQYYVDNSSSGDIVYDGKTVALVAEADIVPCQTYHIKIAIADAGDGIYDSGVFLEASSSVADGVSWDLGFSANGFTYAVENCVDAFVTFHREDATNDTTFDITFAGTATYGVDYEPISTSVYIPAGQDSITLVLHPYEDYITEGTETVDIIYQTGCGFQDTIHMAIVDEPLVNASFTADQQSVCEGSVITYTYTGGNENDTGITYIWDFGPQATVLSGSDYGPYQVRYDVPGSYTTTLIVAAFCDSDTTSLPITINPIPTSDFTIADHQICSSNNTTITYTGTGDSDDTYYWDFGSGSQIISGSGQGPYVVHWNNLGQAVISLQVISSEGCDSEVSIDTVTIMPSPHPNAGQDDEVCGYTYHLNGTLSSQNSTCEWTVASTPSGGTASFTHADNPQTYVNVNLAGDYSFVLHETDTALNCDNYDTVNVTFILPPSAPFTVDTINCYGDATTVEYVGVTGPNSTFHWNFYGGSASTENGPGPIQVQWSTPGVHTISLWVDNDGCYSDTNIITLYNPYPLEVNVTPVNPTCHGANNGQIESYVTGGRPPYSYEWNNGSVNASLYGLSSGHFIVTVTDQGGCTDTAQADIYEPDPLVISVPDTLRACNHDSTTIYVAATGGVYPYQFHWNTGDTSQLIAIEVNGNASYSVYVTDANGCQTSPRNITIMIPDTLRLTAIPEKDSVCPGESVTINTEITGGLEPFSIYLNSNPVYPPISVFPTSINHNYTITVEDICGSQASQDINIGVYPVPVLSFSTDTNAGCSPLTVTFNNNAANPDYEAYWVFEDSTGIYNGDRITHTFTAPGLYDVNLTVITDKGCKTSLTKPDFIEVYPDPVAHFVTEPSTVYIINPHVNFINESYNGSYYAWSFGDGDSSLAINPSHTYRDTGHYLVSLFVESDKGCKDTTTYLLVVNDVYTFYVPTAFTPDNDGVNDLLKVFGRNIDEKTYIFSIYDRWGEVIWETTKLTDTWDGIANNHKKVKPGIYTWHAQFYDKLGKYHEESGTITVIY